MPGSSGGSQCLVTQAPIVTFVYNPQNLGQTFTVASHQADRSQSFETGSNAAGYDLGSVWIESRGTVSFNAAIWETDSDGAPSTLLHPLTAPTTFASGTLVFTAPANARLGPVHATHRAPAAL